MATTTIVVNQSICPRSAYSTKRLIAARLGMTLAVLLFAAASAPAAIYQDVILADNPIGYYRFEDASSAAGQPAADSASAAGAQQGAQNGTYRNSVTLTSGKIGNAARFDGGTTGTTDWVDLAFQYGPLLNGAAAVSVEAWIKEDGTPSGNVQFIFGTRINSGGAGFDFDLTTAGSLRTAGRSQAADSFQFSDSISTDFDGTDGFHHVVGVLDYANDEIRVYIDGVLDSAASATFGSSTYSYGTGTQEDSIGRSPTGVTGSGASGFEGLIDELAVYRYALDDPNGNHLFDDSLVAAHYQAGFAIPEPSSLGLLGLALGGFVVRRRRAARNRVAPRRASMRLPRFVPQSIAMVITLTGFTLLQTPTIGAIATIDVSADTWIDSGQSAVNFGTDTFLRMGTGGPASGTGRGLLRFDLSSISSGATINDVTLQGIQTDTGVATGWNTHQVTSTWDELTVTDASVPTFSGTALGLWPINGSGTSGGLSTFNDSDLTSLVQAWVDGSQLNFGLLLTQVGGSGDTLASREHLTSLIPPQLVIDYTAPVPEPSSVALMLLGIGLLSNVRRKRTR